MFGCAHHVGSIPIQGSWKVYADDDIRFGAIPNEIIHFWQDGIYSITGDRSFWGKYINQTRSAHFLF